MNGAILSDDRYYRYRLWRDVPGGAAGRAVFVMLNPSTANAEHDDPTIRRCNGFAARFGFTRYDVVNLFSYRSDFPDRLLRDDVFATGPDHWQHVNETLLEADIVILAWGAHKSAFFRAPEMLGLITSMGKTPLCLGTNANGSPKHPLYLAKDTELISYDL